MTTPEPPGAGDTYAATAATVEILNADFRPAQVEALEALAPLMRHDHGPVLDIGAGNGLNCAWVLEHDPSATVVALEPSPSMHTLALARIAAHPEWFDRITLWPYDFATAPLPESIAGAIMLGVIGHFDADARSHLFTELAARLPQGGATLIDLQAPEEPQRIEPFDFSTTRIGELTYQGHGEAWPVDGEKMTWRMTYRTYHGDTLLAEQTTEHLYHHPAHRFVAQQAEDAGLRLDRIGDSTYWLLRRP